MICSMLFFLFFSKRIPKSFSYTHSKVGVNDLVIFIFVKNENTNLILTDSPEHTCYFELDTNNPPNFETIQTVLKNIKRKKKEINDLKAKTGQKK